VTLPLGSVMLPGFVGFVARDPLVTVVVGFLHGHYRSPAGCGPCEAADERESY
jgi:hypothetical protein